MNVLEIGPLIDLVSYHEEVLLLEWGTPYFGTQGTFSIGTDTLKDIGHSITFCIG